MLCVNSVEGDIALSQPESEGNTKIKLKKISLFIPPANCVCGWVYCFHVVRPSDRVCLCPYVLFP